MSAGFAWRALTVFAALVAAAALAAAPLLVSKISDNTQQNRATICSIGSFLTGAPVVNVARVPHEAFIGQLLATREFLRDLSKLDCPSDGGFGSGVTAEAIAKQLRRIHHVLRRERAAAARERARHIAEQASGEPGTSSEPPTGSVTSPTASVGPVGQPNEGGGATSPPPGGGQDEPPPGNTGGGGSSGGSDQGGANDVLDQVHGTVDQTLDNAEGLTCQTLQALCPP